MRFPPKPENDFAQYIRLYYDECRHRFDSIEGIAGKWMFRDLIPGMSDFDTRFIVKDGMAADDWCAMSTAIGEAHLALCQEYPCWARNLEHLPGVNLTWTELTSERMYCPEYQQWTFYHTEEPSKLSGALEQLANRAWDSKDEYFHLKKFCNYYGRYDRAIDPPVNLGPHEGKYPLHSRIMHYFAPPVQSAVCILENRNIAGKFDAFDIARSHFPSLPCWETVGGILHGNYETPSWYEEPDLTRLEDELEFALKEIAARLSQVITLAPHGADVGEWKKALRVAPVDPALVIFENAKFSRLMKGRFQFYAHAPDHFDTAWLIGNDLKRMGDNFLHVPFRIYWRHRTGEYADDVLGIVENLHGGLLNDEEAAAAREFERLTSRGWKPGEERSLALAIAEVFDSLFKALHRITLEVASL